MSETRKARLWLILSMTVFGTIALFVRRIDLPSGEIAFWRALLATLLLGGYMLMTRRRWSVSLRGRALPLLFLSGAAMGLNWILLFEAYRYTTVSAATLSYYFAPVLVTAACPILFGERLGKLRTLCFVCATVGLVLITAPASVGRGDAAGILLGLGAAVLYATVILLNKFIRGVQDIPRTFFQFLAATLTLLPYILLTGGFHLAAPDAAGWAALLTVGVLHTGVIYCLYFSALRRLPGQESALLSYIDPVVAVLISVFALGEPITPAQVVGGALIIGFSLWSELLAHAAEK